MKRTLYTFLIGLICTFSSFAQPFDLILTTAESGAQVHQALNSITLAAGYSYTPNGGTMLSEIVNPYVTGAIGYNSTIVNPSSRLLNTGASYLVGTSSGVFNLTPTGAAAYTIAIETPAGVGGLRPELAISYNSMAGPGLVGYGWNIAGLSSITRSGKNYYNDAACTGVDLTSNDRFSLDGNRLVSSSGTYGSDLSEYRTENDIFSRIICYTGNYGPDKFEVKTKSGLIYQYGYDNDADQMIDGINETVSWKVNRITDLYGNQVNYDYFRKNGNNYLAQITYGPAGENIITFFYKSRNDNTASYLNGKKMEQNLLLDKIEIKFSSNIVRKYEFKYNYTTSSHSKYSVLNEVIEYGTGSSQLNSTAFSYHWADDVSFALSATNSTNTDISGTSRIFPGDFNGDGKDDIYVLKANNTDWKYYINNGNDSYTLSASGTHTGFEINDISVSDLNADGKDDLMLVDYQTSQVVYLSTLSTGTTFGGLNVLIQSAFDFRIFNDEFFNYTADFNGDGINDCLIKRNYNGESLWSIFSYGNGGLLSPSIAQRYNGTINTWGDKNFIADFNGDGKIDLWIIDSSGLTIYSLVGTSLAQIYTSGYPTNSNSYKIDDFNGDGKADIFVYGSTSGDYLDWEVYRSTGTAFDRTTIPQKKSNLKGDNVRIADFNGDGMADVMATANQTASSINFFITTDDGKDMAAYSFIETDISKITFRYALGDFDGDGRKDYIVTNTSGWTGYKCYRKYLNPSIKLNWIANGLNNKTQIVYKNITEAGATSIYQKGSGASFPVKDFQKPLQVVSSVLYDNGLGSLNTINYSYMGAKLHLQGRGLLCYSKMKNADGTTGIINETLSGYNSTYFYPQVNLVRKKTTSGTIERITNTWSQLVLDGPNKRIFPYVQSSVRLDSLSGHTVTSTISTIDSYGNPTQTVKSYGNGVSETTVNAYTNTVNSTEWKLGRLNNSTVTYSKSGETSVSNTVRYTYSTDGILKPDYIYFYEGTPLAYTKDHDYDSKGNVTKVVTSGTSVGTSQVSFTYETNGIRLKTKTDELGHITTLNYNPLGQLLTELDYLSNTNTYAYDALGRQTSVSNTNGSQITTTYAWTGNDKPANGVYLVTQAGNDGSVTSAWYDKLQRNLRSSKIGFNEVMILTDTEFNSKGQISRVSDPYFSGGTPAWVETYALYDAFGRINTINRNTGRNTSFGYASNRVTETTAGKISWKEYDSQGLPTASHDNGGDIIYTYYPDGKVKNITAPGGATTTMLYADAARNQTQLVDPSAGTINYTYDSFGRIKTQTNARGQQSTYTYLPDGRADNVVTPDGTTTYSYNTSKQLTGISSPNSISRTYGYDTKGRVSSVVENIAGPNFSTSFTYDTYGRLSTKTHPSGIEETNHYNNSGYLDYIQAGGLTRYAITSMNAREQLTAATYGSNLSATFDYETNGGFLKFSKTGSIQDYRYTFDPVTGNLSTRQNYLRSLSESFTYDNLDRLLTVTGPQNLTMTFAANGNISTKSDISSTTNLGYGTSAGPYALTGVTSSTGVIPTTSQSANYTSFEKVSTLTEGNYAAAFLYNSDNQRAKMTVAQSGSTILTRWYAGNSYMKETAGSAIKEYTYIGGDAYTAPVAAITQSGSTNYYYLLRDYLGNITHQVNTSNVVVAEYNFDVWGRRRDKDNWSYTLTSEPALFADRGFTGHEYLSYFNLYNMNGRLYDPLVGRFLSADPIIGNGGFTQSYNRYSYCLNNPLKYTDPSGYNYKPTYWDEAIGGGGVPVRTYGRHDFTANSVWNNWTGGSNYSYDQNHNRYLDQFGNVVSYQKVHNSYVVPNSSVDRLYTHISTLAGIFSTGTMMDGFKMNGVLYEFDHPVSYNQTFVAQSGGGNYITGEYYTKPFATISSVTQGDGRIKFRLNPGGKIGLGFAETDVNVTGTLKAEILAKRYVNGSLAEQRIISYQLDLTRQMQIGIGVTIKMFSWYSLGSMLFQAPGRMQNGIEYYGYYKDAFEAIGNDVIIPNAVAKGAFGQ